MWDLRVSDVVKSGHRAGEVLVSVGFSKGLDLCSDLRVGCLWSGQPALRMAAPEKVSGRSRTWEKMQLNSDIRGRWRPCGWRQVRRDMSAGQQLSLRLKGTVWGSWLALPFCCSQKCKSWAGPGSTIGYWRLRQEKHKFKASLGVLMRPCRKKECVCVCVCH